ncbi:MAG: hypothetical protein QM739_16905 [Propionivibrio sp.]
MIIVSNSPFHVVNYPSICSPEKNFPFRFSEIPPRERDCIVADENAPIFVHFQERWFRQMFKVHSPEDIANFFGTERFRLIAGKHGPTVVTAARHDLIHASLCQSSFNALANLNIGLSKIVPDEEVRSRLPATLKVEDSFPAHRRCSP